MTNRPAYQEIHYGDCAHRPGMYSILIPGKRGRLFSVLYTAAGEGPHPTVLQFHGIPGCERNFDLAQALRRGGFHVMAFHYSGSWAATAITRWPTIWRTLTRCWTSFCRARPTA